MKFVSFDSFNAFGEQINGFKTFVYKVHVATWRKVNLKSYHRKRNGYCADCNSWVEILCCSYSAFATVLARAVLLGP